MHHLIVCILLVLAFASAAIGQEIVVNAVGDIMLAGRATPVLARIGYDHPFVATAPLLRRGDVTIGNLEAPAARIGTEFKGKKFRFRADPSVVPALQRAGFTVLTLANNHILDFGPEAMLETIGHLERQGLGFAGAGADMAAARKECIQTVHGKRVAVLAYSLTQPTEFLAGSDRPGTAPGWGRFFAEDIARSKSRADHVVVSFHWGGELETRPKPYQVAAARRAIDAGADVVIGHHPHVLQGVERYNGGVIFYSLGNFAFASRSRHADRSVIARIVLDDGVKEVELIPLNVLHREVGYQPRVLTGRRGDAVIARLKRLSEGMGTTITARAGRYLVGGSGEQVARQ